MYDLSRRTVSRRLKGVGLLCRRPAKKSRLIDRHKRARRRYIQRQWSDEVFSDESSFPIQKLDMRERVYRQVGERFADACLRREQDRRSVMVWGGISLRGKTELIICHGNIDAANYHCLFCTICRIEETFSSCTTAAQSIQHGQHRLFYKQITSTSRTLAYQKSRYEPY